MILIYEDGIFSNSEHHFRIPSAMQVLGDDLNTKNRKQTALHVHSMKDKSFLLEFEWIDGDLFGSPRGATTTGNSGN